MKRLKRLKPDDLTVELNGEKIIVRKYEFEGKKYYDISELANSAEMNYLNEEFLDLIKMDAIKIHNDEVINYGRFIHGTTNDEAEFIFIQDIHKKIMETYENLKASTKQVEIDIGLLEESIEDKIMLKEVLYTLYEMNSNDDIIGYVYNLMDLSSTTISDLSNQNSKLLVDIEELKAKLKKYE